MTMKKTGLGKLIRRGLRPGLKFGLDSPAWPGFRKALPFKRSWIAIAVVAALDAIFFIPAIAAFTQAASHWGSFDSLFDLVFAVFMSAWLLGWSVALVLLSSVLVILLFGREVIRAKPGKLEILLGLPGVGALAVYDASKVRNLRHAEAPEKSGTSWRGEHLMFDYGANAVSVGSAINAEEASELIRLLEAGMGGAVRKGEAHPDELAEVWETEKEVEGISPVDIPAAKTSEPLTLASPTSLALIAANLVPLFGTVLFGWKLSDVMVLYWAESAIIGFFTICKMIVIGRWLALLAVPFFIGHFGGFMAVHFLFIYLLFVEGDSSGGSFGGDLPEVGRMFIVLWPALAALFISHAWSYVQNFLGRKEYLKRTLKDQMSEPYKRIIFMHLVIIFGGGLALVLGAPEPVLFIVIVVKIYVDLKAHLKEHRSG